MGFMTGAVATSNRSSSGAADRRDYAERWRVLGDWEAEWANRWLKRFVFKRANAP